MPSPLLRFYRHQGPDHAGRMLAEIWHWPYSSLEAHHDYIQWLFPLDTPSGANARAPILTEEDIAHWQHDPMLRMYLRRSFEKLLDFYGFAIINNNGHARIIAASNAATRQQAWITQGNHNYLRLTRIVKSLRLLGEAELADALRTALEHLGAQHGATIGEETVRYWREA